MSQEVFWQVGVGGYEYEYGENGYTGWYRCSYGRLSDGRWPEWHSNGQKRYSY